jgi:hypothetical protein
VKAIPYAVPIATPEPTPEADLIKLAGPMPNTDTPWGVSLAVHDAIKDKLNDPDSYKYIGVYKLRSNTYDGKSCWLERVKFRAKNAFGGYVVSIASVWIVVSPANRETILNVEIN